MKNWRDFWWSIAMWLSLWIAVCMTLMVYAGSSTPGPTPFDPILVYMQAAGFPAWAGVVAWGVLRITTEIKSIATKLDAFIVQTERRLIRLEAHSNILEAPKDFSV